MPPVGWPGSSCCRSAVGPGRGRDRTSNSMTSSLICEVRQARKQSTCSGTNAFHPGHLTCLVLGIGPRVCRSHRLHTCHRCPRASPRRRHREAPSVAQQCTENSWIRGLRHVWHMTCTTLCDARVGDPCSPAQEVIATKANHSERVGRKATCLGPQGHGRGAAADVPVSGFLYRVRGTGSLRSQPESGHGRTAQAPCSEAGWRKVSCICSPAAAVASFRTPLVRLTVLDGQEKLLNCAHLAWCCSCSWHSVWQAARRGPKA